MRVLSFLRYSLESVIRNKRRSLFAIVGIVLALSLISGSFIAVDSSALGMLRAAIDKVGVDFVAYDEYYNYSVPVNEDYFAPRLDAIRSVKDIEAASALVVINGWKFSNGSFTIAPYEYLYESMVFLPEDSDKLLDAYKIVGQLPDMGTAAISKATADQFAIEVGGSVMCTYVQSTSWYDNGTWRQNYTYLNLSFVVTQIWTQEGTFGSDWYYPYVESDEDSVQVFDYWDPVVLNMADFAQVTNAMTSNNFSYGQNTYYLIWLDRDKVINLGDVPGSIDRIEFIQHRLQREGYEHGFSVYDSRLVGPLSELYPQLESMKLLFLILSLPVVALGVYLSVVGVDLGVTERRREVGILKSRGASNKQVFASLILESLSLGAFAGILGLALGLFVSRFLLGAATAFVYQGEGEARISDYGMTSGTIILSVLFGVLLTFLSSYRPFKRVSRTDVAEALHHYSPMVARIGYKPRTDIVLLGISMLSIVSVLLGPSWAFDQEWSWITRLLLTLLLLAGLAAFPAMPFLLSLSVIRLLTRTSHRLYAKFTWIVKPWTKELHHLVDKNIVRNPRRASNLCVIISLALAFGLFISVTMESTMAYEKETIVYEVGADAKVSGYFSRYYSSLNLSRLAWIDSVEGVEGISQFTQLSIEVETYGYGSYGLSAALIDPGSFKEVVDPSGFYFVGGGSDMLEDLEINGTVLVSKHLANDMDILVDDPLHCRIWFANESDGNYYRYSSDFTLRVAGIVKGGLPGFPYDDLFLSRETLDFVSDQELTSSESGFTLGAFVDIDDAFDHTEVADDVRDVYSSAGLEANLLVLEDELNELKTENPAFRALSDFLYMEYALSVAIMTVGVGLLIFVAVTDREQELACIMARGASGSQMRKILMGESVTLMIIGLVVGASVGLLTAYLFNTLSGEEMYTAVERRMIFTYVSWSIVLASIGALLVASLLATARAGKVRLAEVLRIRGG